MGDRRTAKIQMSNGSLYIYSHGGGKSMVQDAEQAIIAAKSRWHDESYATRIIVDQMTKYVRDRTEGYGLMLCPAEGGDEYGANPSIIIDLRRRRLVVCSKNEKESYEKTFSSLL